MAVPVLYSFAKRYPMHQLTLLSRENAAPLFSYAPENIHFLGINLNKYSGVVGLTELYHELQAMHFDGVADFHDVLRTKYLRLAFHAGGVPTASIDKGRSDRRALTRKHDKKAEQLTDSFERYALVLAELGYPFEIHFQSIFSTQRPALPAEITKVTGLREGNWVGIAPFAQHEGKIYPLDLMEQVIALLDSRRDMHIFLFGAGEKEKEWCLKCQNKFSNVLSLVGSFHLEKELLLMSHLDAMVSMDSANMHLASLVNTPVVSLWGATHPYAGFAGLQPKGSIILQKSLDCRPCSIFGTKPCFKSNYECLRAITPQEVVDAILRVFNQNVKE